MEITWLGHSCFRIKSKEATIITDPFDETSGYPLKKLSADIVTVSHAHPRHSFTQGITGNPKLIQGPGEYEITGVFIYGLRCYRDLDKGKTKGANTVYLMEIEGTKLCHLGDLGHTLSAAQVEEVSDPDVLLVPVGGPPTIDAAGAAEVINLIQPKIVIPMHYKTDVSKPELDPLDKFLKEMGIKEANPIPKLTVNESMLPIETQVVVLDYK